MKWLRRLLGYCTHDEWWNVEEIEIFTQRYDGWTGENIEKPQRTGTKFVMKCRKCGWITSIKV